MSIITTGRITTENLTPTAAPTAGSAVEAPNTKDYVDNGVAAIQARGTYTGALTVQVNVSGSPADWVTVPVTGIDGTQAAVIPSGDNGIWRADVAGAAAVRVTALAAVTGTADVAIRLAQVSPPASLGTVTTGDGSAATLGAGEEHIGQVGGAVLNPSASFVRPANTTQYAVGDLVANNETAGSVVPMQFTAARIAAGSFHITRARLRKSDAGITASAFRLHLFNSAPTVTNGDNGAFLPSGSANYLGALDIAVNRACSDGAVGVAVPVVGNAISAKLAAGTIIYGLLEALNTYTPVSGETFAVTLEVIPD